MTSAEAPATRTPNRPRRDPALDGIRGIAVLLVCLDHALGLRYSVLTVGLDLFFALSGYLITSLALAESSQTGTIRMKAFFERRVRRIFPALLLFLLASVLLGAAGRLPTPTVYIEAFFGAVLLYPLAFVLVPEVIELRLSHLHSLFQEEWFYIFWVPALGSMLAKGRMRRAFRVACAIAALGALSRLALTLAGSPAVEGVLRPDIMFFGSVIAFARYGWVQRTGGDQRPGRAWVWLTSAGLVLLVGSIVVGVIARHPNSAQWMDSLFAGRGDGAAIAERLALMSVGFSRLAAPAAVAATFVYRSDAVVLRVLRNPVLRWYGLVSYGLYLWHPIVLFVLHPDMVIDAKHVWITFPGPSWRPLFDSIVLSAALAWVSFRFFEQRFLKRSNLGITADAIRTSKTNPG
ncbi:MAG: acyltransferase [Microthrixaceae bacterium]|nr:acyltransferase [Microthrixaceae bacterium]MCO5312920.1 acyltransferase [Microthrixaceae bacterium]